MSISLEDTKELYEICSTHYFATSHKQQLALSLLMMKIRNYSKEDVINFLTENGIPVTKKEPTRCVPRWQWKGNTMKEINTGDFQLAVLDDNIKIPIVVDFWATYCSPCRVQASLIEQLAREQNGKAHFYSVNIENNGELAMEYNIKSLPTLVFFKNGKPIDRLIGLQSKKSILSKIS